MSREIAPTHPPRSPIRLDLGFYAQSGQVCSITVATKERLRVFESRDVVTAAIKVLKDRARVHQVRVFAYCFMPDHLHLLISPSEACDVITFVGQVKNLIQREAWRFGVQGTIWQKRFWDHFLRQEEDIESVVEYIFMNPVRAGLVEEWNRYPYSGSLVWDSFQ